MGTGGRGGVGGPRRVLVLTFWTEGKGEGAEGRGHGNDYVKGAELSLSVFDHAAYSCTASSCTS
jgi:hypothetical protein